MIEITIPFPKRLKEEIEMHPEIDLAVVFKKAAVKILHRLELIEFLDTKLENSEFTEEDALKLSELVKEKRLKQLKSEGLL